MNTRVGPAISRSLLLLACLCGTGADRTILQPVVSAQSTQPAAPPALRPLPTSDRSLRILVNVTTSVGMYRPDVLAAEPGLLGLHAIYEDARDDAAWLRAAVRLRTVNPAGQLGIAVSGDSVIKAPDVQYWPPERLSFDAFPAAYLRGPYVAADRAGYVKLEHDASRLHFARAIAAHVAATEAALLAKDPRAKLDWVFLDNNAYPSTGVVTPWPATCDLLAALKCRLNVRGIRLLANVAGRPCDMAITDARLLAASVDGVYFEQPLDFRTVADREALERECAVYEELLASGKLVVLGASVQVPPDVTGMTSAARQAAILAAREQRRAQVAALAALVRQPGQSIFLDSESWLAERTCDRLPGVLGPPLGPLQLVSGDQGVRHTRRFAGGTLTLDSAAGTVRLDPPSP